MPANDKQYNPKTTAKDEVSTELQILLAALKNKDVEERRQAIRRLGRLGPVAVKALPELRAALTDSNFVIRLEAAVAIGFIGTKEDTKYLLPLLDDAEEPVRFQTISALAFLRDSSATPILLQKYDMETPSIRDQILRAMGHIAGPEAFPLLERGLKDEEAAVRTGAVVGLGFLGDPRARALLKKIADEDPNEIVAHEARITLLELKEN